jgi:hypothetical protein
LRLLTDFTGRVLLGSPSRRDGLFTTDAIFADLPASCLAAA